MVWLLRAAALFVGRQLARRWWVRWQARRGQAPPAAGEGAVDKRR